MSVVCKGGMSVKKKKRGCGPMAGGAPEDAPGRAGAALPARAPAACADYWLAAGVWIISWEAMKLRASPSTEDIFLMMAKTSSGVPSLSISPRV